MRTVFLVIFGFGVVLVAFGVTEMVTEHAPVLRPLTDVPERLQFFLDAAAMVNVTFAPAGIETSAALAIVALLISLPIRTTGAAAVAGSVLDNTGVATDGVLVVDDDVVTAHAAHAIPAVFGATPGLSA